jgi:hypothetical protein
MNLTRQAVNLSFPFLKPGIQQRMGAPELTNLALQPSRLAHRTHVLHLSKGQRLGQRLELPRLWSRGRRSALLKRANAFT